MPQSLLLGAKGVDSTVTVVHSRTKDTRKICANADIVIAAVGIPEMVKPDWIKEGAVVVDVGINRVDDPSREAAGGLQVMFILMWLKKLGGFHRFPVASVR